MSSSTWTVDPGQDWLDQNQSSLMEANLPTTERCGATLTGVRCELKLAHEGSHMIYRLSRPSTQSDPGAFPRETSSDPEPVVPGPEQPVNEDDNP